MNHGIYALLDRIGGLELQLEREVAAELGRRRRRLKAGTLDKSVLGTAARAGAGKALAALVAFSLLAALLLLDFSLWVLQSICFPAYRLQKVRRSEYLASDREGLASLDRLERFNSRCCGYANGLLAYAREVAARAEQYFSPLQHAKRSLHAYHRYARFFERGDEEGYAKGLAALRRERVADGADAER